MSRSGYSDEMDDLWAHIRWRGAVNSAMTGKRGQDFLREMLAALDALPQKRLERSVLVEGTNCCAMGAVALARGLDVASVDPENPRQVSEAMGIARAMAQEIASENDDDFNFDSEETPERRWIRMRSWVAARIIEKEST